MKTLKAINSVLCLAFLCSCTPASGVEEKPLDTRVLEFADDNLEAGYEGGRVELQMNVNFEYKVDIQDEWIRISDEKASDRTAVVLTVEPNQSASARTGTIKVSDANDRYYAKIATVSQSGNPTPETVLSIVDKNATSQTKALFANLWDIADRGFMFGHHDDLWYGRYWYNEAGNSDTKAVCGDYPAVFSVDFGPVMDNRYNSEENKIRRRVILEAKARGEVITACAHLNNPLTGGDSWDNSSKEVVKGILTQGSDVRKKYMEWLDRLAEFALNLKDENGDLIPVLFRPYHEHTQTWSWWGASCTTESEFIELWRMTVSYLRDTKGVHNFLYSVSPQMDAVYSDTKDRILFRWPGDEWVDFIGMDCYHGLNRDAFLSNLEAIESVSKDKKKPCGVTETGQEAFKNTDYWTRYILEPLKGRRVSLVVMWRNKYVGSNESDTHYFSVYPGHASEEDFRTMYRDSRTIFSEDLPDMYIIPKQYIIK